MSSHPDLFVVCKHCGSEVSPYITECPYCGQRLRRRAPKLPREGVAERSSHRFFRRRGGRVGRSSATLAPARTGRVRIGVPGGFGSRPYVTIALVGASCVMWVLVRAGFISAGRLVIVGPLEGEWWKLFSSQFVYLNGLYAFFALLAIALFGWLLERRLGGVAVLVLFLGAGATGALAALAAYPLPILSGANAGALALLAAWSVPDLLAARAGDYYEGDLLGAGAIAAVLLALPFARPEASWLAGLTGGAVGLLAGLGMHRVRGVEG